MMHKHYEIIKYLFKLISSRYIYTNAIVYKPSFVISHIHTITYITITTQEIRYKLLVDVALQTPASLVVLPSIYEEFL